VWYPIQVKQKDRAGRPDIDSFEAAMMRANRTKGFFISFEFSSDALREVDAFFRREHRVIIPLTVREILEESIARKLLWFVAPRWNCFSVARWGVDLFLSARRVESRGTRLR
jgi:hypothetical protein